MTLRDLESVKEMELESMAMMESGEEPWSKLIQVVQLMKTESDLCGRAKTMHKLGSKKKTKSGAY